MSLLLLLHGTTNHYSLAGNAGTYAVTGIAASLKLSHNLNGNNGSYSLVGQSATLALSRKLSGSNGTYSVTGQNAVFVLARKLAGLNGTYTVNGQNATLTYTSKSPTAYTLSGQAGTYLLSGQNAQLVWSGATTSAGDPYDKQKRRRKREQELKRFLDAQIAKEIELTVAAAKPVETVTQKVQKLFNQPVNLVIDDEEDDELAIMYLL